MLLSCPNCETSYEVDRTSLGPTGRSVRCLRCRHIWFASNSAAFAEIADAHRADMAALAGAPPPDETYAAISPAMPSATQADETSAQDSFTVASAPEHDQDTATATPAAATDDPGLVTVSAAEASLAPTDEGNFPSSIEAGPQERTGADIETVAARRTRRAAKRRRNRSLQRLTTTILVQVAVITGLIAWRTDVVRWMPQTASLYAMIGMPVNLRGLEFADIKTETETKDGVPVLVVSGDVVSASQHPVEVPRIRFAVRNESGKEIYAWTALPSRAVLAPGGTLPFRSRLASPPSEGRQVLVRFFNRRDIAAGLQ